MKFGNIIQYRGEPYVYLAATTEIIYLAKIVDLEKSREFTSLRQRLFSRGSASAAARSDSLAWCFVTLRTNQFKDQIALYGNPGQEYSASDFFDVIGVLEEVDMAALKKEIPGDKAVSNELRELIKGISI